ncbi:MAG: hypothetical protein OK436_07310 [Thaumarchaeota archaeon]|nr:hypothetical protein [Nitrososphaerota archaeon]
MEGLTPTPAGHDSIVPAGCDDRGLLTATQFDRGGHQFSGLLSFPVEALVVLLQISDLGFEALDARRQTFDELVTLGGGQRWGLARTGHT